MSKPTFRKEIAGGVVGFAGLLLAACSLNLAQTGFGFPSTPPAAVTPAVPSTIAANQPTVDAEMLLLSLPTATPYPNDQFITIGYSVEGRELTAWQFGQGPVTLALIGGIHGGYEFNSVVLVEQLAETVRNDPSLVLPGIRLVMVPTVNPDGVARGTDLEGRFNANGVDLNRNWGCGWEPESYWQDQTISPGPFPFSEPETLALRAYLLAMDPAAVIFYHSQFGAIFVGGCGEVGTSSIWLGDLLSGATGYPNEVTFEYYEISGTADDWLDERGIPAVTVELTNQTDPELERNLIGLMALQCHFALDGSTGAGPVITAQVESQCAGLKPYVPDQ